MPRPHPTREEKGLVTNEQFLGCAESTVSFWTSQWNFVTSFKHMWRRSQKSLWTSALTSLYTGVCHSSLHWCRNIWTAKITQWGTALELMLPPCWTLPCALLRSHMTNIITADLAQPRSRSLVTRPFSPWGGCGLGTRLHQGGCSYPLKNYDFNWHNIFFICTHVHLGAHLAMICT